MSKRLQVLLDEQEHEDLRELARREGIPVSEWVRRALREAGRRVPDRDFEGKLGTIRTAAGHAFPTADIDEMLDEVERGRAA